MIHITGDIHGTTSVNKRLNRRNFPEQKHLTKEDYVIIAGDFGLIWDGSNEDRYWLKWLDKTKCSPLFLWTEIMRTSICLNSTPLRYGMVERYIG